MLKNLFLNNLINELRGMVILSYSFMRGLIPAKSRLYK